MNLRTLRLSYVVLALAAGCGGSAHRSFANSDGGGLDPLQQLEQDTGHSWSSALASGAPSTPVALLEGRTAPLAPTRPPTPNALGNGWIRSFVTPLLFAMAERDDDDVVATDSADTDELRAMTHARFQEQVERRAGVGRRAADALRHRRRPHPHQRPLPARRRRALADATVGRPPTKRVVDAGHRRAAAA